jgi:hypothetical protein
MTEPRQTLTPQVSNNLVEEPNKPIEPDETSGAKTVEEVEAYWRNRVSKKDSAHAAAERALREENETLKRAPAAPSSASQSGTGQSGTESEAEASLRRQNEELKRTLETEKSARVIDTRKAKYPFLVAQGVEDAVFASASEADLAKLNALANDEQPEGTFIAPTGPKRGQPTAPKPYSEKTKDELLADLRKATEAPGFQP